VIPEFINLKPSTIRNVSETLPGTNGNSGEQLLSNDAFQKALQEQTSEQQTSRSGDRRHVSAADETRSEPTSRLTGETTSSDRGSSLQEPSRTAATQSPASGKDAAESNATDGARADDALGTNQDSPGRAKDPQSGEPSKLIRRIDPANHSTSDEAASSSALEPAGNELASQTSDTATLPSLIRRPLGDASISQFPGDILVHNTSASDGDLRKLPAGLVPSVIDDEHLLSDILISDAQPSEDSDRFTATDPFLIVDESQSSPSANVNALIANEDLLSIPTLPSLRPDAASPSPTSQDLNNADRLKAAVVGKLVNEGLADAGQVVSEVPASDVATLGGDSSPISVPLESETQLSADDLPQGTDREPESLDLVLPSLTSGPNRAGESSPVASDGKQLGARNDRVVVQTVDAGVNDSVSRGVVGNDLETETGPGVLRSVDGNDAGEVMIDSTSKPNLATTVGAIESGDRQSRPGADAADVSTNSVVAEPVQLGSRADIQPGRLKTRDSEGARLDLPEDGNGILTSEQAARQRNRVRASSHQERLPGTHDGTVPNPVETSAKVGGEQPSSDGSVPPPSDQLRASERDSRLSPTAVESSSVELRNANTVEFMPVDSSATSSAVQNSQPVRSMSNLPGPVSDTSIDESVTSSASILEVGDDSASRIRTEVRSIDAATVSSIQSPNASPTLAAPARSDVVREPAVPIEIQEAVSAIQEATSGDSHIRVRLNPRELGNMLVDVSRTESGVVARLEVESAAARAAVLETLPDLQRSLARSGASVDRVEVVFTENRAESGRQDADQSQQRDQQQPRQDQQSSDQRQARDGQNQRREQNERHDQRERPETSTGGVIDPDTPGKLDVKL
jgi:flagellar hook-length control protein FliK